MFEGIVMEIKEAYTIVMKAGGEVLRVNTKDGLKVGQRIFCFEEDIYNGPLEPKVINTRKIKKAWILPLSAVAIFMIFFLSPIINMFSPSNGSIYAVLTFDVNPSIEFELDDEGYIVEVKVLNEDGKKLNIQGIEGLTLEEGTVKLKGLLASENYLSEGNSVLVGFSFLGQEDLNFQERIERTMENTFKGTSVAFLKGNEQHVEKAKEQGMSLGKYEALLKLDEDGVEEAIENLSTQELLEILKLHNDKVFLNEEALDEVQDELEDRLEEDNEEDSDEDDDDEEDEDDDEDDDGDEDDEDDDEEDDSHD